MVSKNENRTRRFFNLKFTSIKEFFTCANFDSFQEEKNLEVSAFLNPYYRRLILRFSLVFLLSRFRLLVNGDLQKYRLPSPARL